MTPEALRLQLGRGWMYLTTPELAAQPPSRLAYASVRGLQRAGISILAAASVISFVRGYPPCVGQRHFLRIVCHPS